MLREIYQEIIKLQKDRKFLRNLTLLGISTLALFGGIAEPYYYSATSPQQERVEHFSPFISAGMVIRTYHTVLDKEDRVHKLKK